MVISPDIHQLGLRAPVNIVIIRGHWGRCWREGGREGGKGGRQGGREGGRQGGRSEEWKGSEGISTCKRKSAQEGGEMSVSLHTFTT